MNPFYCRTCDHHFESNAAKPRCPVCLRQHGVEVPAEEPSVSGKRAAKRRPRWIGVMASATVIIAIGISVLHHWDFFGPTQERYQPSDAQTLASDLEHLGVPQEFAALPFSALPALNMHLDLSTDIASDHPNDTKWLAESAERINGSFTEVLVAGAVGEVEQLHSPSEIAEAVISKQRVVVSPLILARTMASVLRGAGLTAGLCLATPVEGWVNEDGVSDLLSVAIYRNGVPSYQLMPTPLARKAVDIGNAIQWKIVDAESVSSCLADSEVVGYTLALEALLLAGDEARSKDAFTRVAAAARLAGNVAAVKVAEALVVFRLGGMQDGIKAAQKAVTLRDDPPRRAALAGLLLQSGQPERAATELALTREASFWPAELLSAGLAWSEGKTEEGDAHLANAVKLAPFAPAVRGLLATQQMRLGDFDRAAEILAELERVKPSKEVRLMLYLALRQQGNDTAAGKVRDRLLRDANDDPSLKQYLEQIEAGLSPEG